jgi:hypothetical protein
LAHAFTVRAGVERLAVAARVRVELAPLLGRLPLAGAVSVSFVDAPDLAFALTLYGGDVTLLPGLEAWLAGLLRDWLRPFVLPGRFTYPLTKGPVPSIMLPDGMAVRRREREYGGGGGAAPSTHSPAPPSLLALLHSGCHRARGRRPALD